MRLASLIPTSLKRPIKSYIASLVQREQLYLPSHPGQDSYVIDSSQSHGEGLPVPPQELWLDMAEDVQSYVNGGKADVEIMLRIAEEGGISLAKARRVLDFGCAAGRMLRHLPTYTAAEIWGVDISAEHIGWCIDNYPGMRFATTTIVPHLPFEDRFFDFIYCGSVFTHIEDLRESWLLELGRVLKPSGGLYLTVHDENTVKLLESKAKDKWLAKLLREHELYQSHKNSFSMISIGRGAGSQVFYNSSYFKAKLPSLLRCISYTPETYGYQSAVLLGRV